MSSVKDGVIITAIHQIEIIFNHLRLPHANRKNSDYFIRFNQNLFCLREGPKKFATIKFHGKKNNLLVQRLFIHFPL